MLELLQLFKIIRHKTESQSTAGQTYGKLRRLMTSERFDKFEKERTLKLTQFLSRTQTTR